MAKGYWGTLLEKMKSDLESDAWRTLSSYTIAGKSFSYRSFDEFKKIFDWVADEAAKEEGIAPYRGRQYAGNAGRGGFNRRFR